MNDFILIWTGFMNIIVSLWSFLAGWNNGLVIAVIVVMVMLITLKKIFFKSGGEDK